MNRRVDVAEVPFVGRDLTVRVQVALLQQQQDLLLGVGRIDQSERHGVERQIPRRVPGILPLVRHRDDVGVHHVRPVGVAVAAAIRPPGRRATVRRQPGVDVVVVELLAPEHARQGLANDRATIGGERGRDDLGVKLVRLALARLEHPRESLPQGAVVVFDARAGEAQPKRLTTLRRDLEGVVRRRLGPHLSRVDRLLGTIDDVVVDPVLEVAECLPVVSIRLPLPAPGIGLVVGEEKRRPRLAVEQVFTERGARGRQHRRLAAGDPDLRPLDLLSAASCFGTRGSGSRCSVAACRPSVVSRDFDQQILWPRLGVVDEQVEVLVVAEDAGVDELVLEIVARATGVGLDQLAVRECQLGVLVEVPHVGMCRRAVEVEVVLLDVLAVVPLRVGEAEQAFLEDRIAPVPEREREAERLLVVGDSGRGRPRPSGTRRSGRARD